MRHPLAISRLMGAFAVGLALLGCACGGGGSSSAAPSAPPTPAPVAVSLQPTVASLETGGIQSFEASVTGTSNPAVTWSVVEAGGGSVDAHGLYTAPASQGTFHVRATSAADTGSRAEAVVTVTASAPAPTPSAYLLLSTARLDRIRADAAAGKAAWLTLKRNVDTFLASTDETDSSTENFATAYLVTKDRRYADRAFFWAQHHMAKTLREDDYYFFGDRCRAVALTLNYCADALSAAQAKALADFLDGAPDELWFHNQGNGWALDDPRNNYHQTFVMGTAFAGYALKAAGDVRGDRWISHFKDKLAGPGGVLDYLDTGVPGGDWDEGMNYAMGSKMHLGLALALMAAAGDTNYFNTTPFFQNASRFLLAATQPGGQFLYPGGDLAWSSAMPLSPFYRAALQPAVFWQGDCEGRRLGQWILTHLVPTYTDGDRTINLLEAYYLDVLFAADLPETDPATLPTGYHTPVTQWVNLRSGWDDGATSLSISGSPRILESHQHMDTGSFTLWKRDWQAADASTYSPSGEIQGAAAHNLLRVPGSDWFNDESLQVPGMQRYEDLGALAYAQVDITRLYRHVVSSSDIQDLLTEHTREFVYLRPDTVVVFDRVAATPAAAGLAWCLHFPQSPTFANGRYSATHGGGGMSLVKLLGGAVSVQSDGDLEARTSSFRLEEAAAASTTRFLNVLEVAAGAPPATAAQLVSTPGAVQGAKVGSTVVLFSDRPRGAAPVLPFTYTVPGTDRLDHVLCNMAAGVDVHAVASGGNTVVTLTSGTQVQPDAQGVVRFSAAP